MPNCPRVDSSRTISLYIPAYSMLDGRRCVNGNTEALAPYENWDLTFLNLFIKLSVRSVRDLTITRRHQIRNHSAVSDMM